QKILKELKGQSLDFLQKKLRPFLESKKKTFHMSEQDELTFILEKSTFKSPFTQQELDTMSVILSLTSDYKFLEKMIYALTDDLEMRADSKIKGIMIIIEDAIQKLKNDKVIFFTDEDVQARHLSFDKTPPREWIFFKDMGNYFRDLFDRNTGGLL
ncbi:MAG: hypothetical protein Q8K36_04695, partial [Alphaproteobacteria bacterium]|nr:hypothetical protein [Alphaproteobacteria bacterium]